MQKIQLDKNHIKALFIENLCASYFQTQVLKDCSLSLHPGDFICLCGPNGSGKSTLLSILAGINESSLKITSTPSEQKNSGTKLQTESKEIIPLAQLTRKQSAAIVTLLQQEEYSTWDFSVNDYVLQGRFCHTENANYSNEDITIAEQAMKETGILELKDRNIHSLSGGEFQKVRIARCLCQEPKFLLLDEPASSLDFVYEPKLLQQLKDLAKKRNIGVLLSIHDVNLAARFADKLVLIKKNNPLVSGTVNQVFTKETLSSIYDSPCQIYTHPVYNCLQVTEDTNNL